MKIQHTDRRVMDLFDCIDIRGMKSLFNINDSIPSFIVVGGNQAMVDRKLQSGESGEGYKVSKFFLKLGTKMCFV